MGLSRIRYTYTGGAAMGPDHFRFFHAIGVNLKQIYGQTEIAGISVLHRDGDIKFDTVGRPIPGTEVKITPEGEIISKSPSVFIGYYKMPEETAKTLRDGWLYSGDTGFIDGDGHLVVFDRTKDVMTLSDGTKFAPQYLETRLKFSPYIKDVWAIGDQETLCHRVWSASIMRWWANGPRTEILPTPVIRSFPRCRRFMNWFRREIIKMNRDLPPVAKIKNLSISTRNSMRTTMN